MTQNIIPTQRAPYVGTPTWRERISLPTAALAVALALAVAGGGALGYQQHETNARLVASKAQVRSLTTERDSLQGTLTDTQATLKDAQSDLKDTQEKLTTASNDLADARRDLAGARSSLAEARQRGNALTTNRGQLLTCLHAVLDASDAAEHGDYATAAGVLQANQETCREAISGAGVPADTGSTI